MESDFVGSTVVVTLASPPNGKVRGVVLNIAAGQLRLRDVLWLHSGNRTPYFEILSNNIQDLEVVAEENLPPQLEQTPSIQHAARASVSPQQFDGNGSLPPSLRGSLSLQTDPVPSTVEAPATAPTPSSSTFMDPAIISMNKPPPKAVSVPSNVSKLRSPKLERPPIPRPMLVEAARGSPTRATPTVPPELDLRDYKSASMAAATLSEPFDDLSIERSHEEESEAAELGTDGGMENVGPSITTQSGRRSRGKGKGTGGRDGTKNKLPTHVEEVDSSPMMGKKQLQAAKARAPKQQPVSEVSTFEGNGAAKTKKKTRTRRERSSAKLKPPEGKSGWATEDATDIQELGDFDFAGNLSKFDKREIFRQLKQDDNISAENRLVGHNRLPKPGTAGGKNLHWTENVLDNPHVLSGAVTHNKWIREGSSGDSDSDAVVSSERGSRRAHSRASMFRTISRKGSGKGEPQFTSSITAVRSPSLAIAPSPKTRQPSSPFVGVPRSVLRLADSGKPLPTLSPLQMLEFEQFATTELGLSEDALTENCARGIAEGTLRAFRVRKLSATARPSVLVAIGNHRAGARTLAAARHLRNHGFAVTAAVMERDEGELLDTVRAQGNAFRKAGGKMVKPEVLLAGMKSGNKDGHIKGDVLIEALLGVHRRFEDLRGEEQAWFFEMCMVVRQGWEVASVDVPSGVDAVSGEVTQADPPSAYPLTITSTAVISLCVPKPYLQLVKMSEPVPHLYVTDTGIGNAAWKRLGSRRNKGIDWGEDWIKELHVVEAE